MNENSQFFLKKHSRTPADLNLKINQITVQIALIYNKFREMPRVSKYWLCAKLHPLYYHTHART